MNFLEEGNILYIASVDISLPNGPGVNEREFVLEMSRVLGKRFYALIPKPKYDLSELKQNNFYFSHPTSLRNPLDFLLHQLDQTRLARKLMRQTKFDLLVVRHSLMAFSLNAITSASSTTPFVVKTIGARPEQDVDHHKGVLGWIKKQVFGLSELTHKALVKHALSLDACTEKLVQSAKVRFPDKAEKIVLFDNATNTERFFPSDVLKAREKLSLDSFSPIIGYVGGRPWERGGTQAVELVAQLKQFYPNIATVVVGAGDGMPALEEKANQLGVGGRCFFPGLIPYEHVPDYVNAFDLGFAFDTKTKSANVGNANQKLRQYLACAKPVVASEGGSEFLEEYHLGSFVDKDNSKKVEEAVLYWLTLTDQEKRDHQQRARNFAVEHLSISKQVHDRLQFWQSLY